MRRIVAVCRRRRPPARAVPRQSTPPARSIASSAMLRPVSMCSRIARCGGSRSPAGERLDDPAVLGDEVRMALDVAAADHLHHQVDGQLAVEPREQRVTGEVDLVLVERRVRRVPLLVRDRRVRRRRADPSKRRAGRCSSCSDRALRGEELECQAHVVALRERTRGHGRDVVPAPRPHGEQPLGDEARQRVMHGASGHAELGRERVQAQLRARPAPGA